MLVLTEQSGHFSGVGSLRLGTHNGDRSQMDLFHIGGAAVGEDICAGHQLKNTVAHVRKAERGEGEQLLAG